MDNNEYNEVKETSWEEVPSSEGEIKFRQDKKRGRSKNLLKAVAFVLIAAISGGATASYIVDKKYSKLPVNQNNQSLLEQKTGDTKTADIPKNSITQVAETVGPAVVGINNKGESFFGTVDQGSGSGIIFDAKGYIVTNYHVIQGADKVTVKLPSGKVLPATFIGGEADNDIAVIKVEADNLPVAKFGDSSKVNVGDVAVAIGNPLGEEFAGTVTSGIVSAINRELTVGTTNYKLLQTDAAINPGNSGGALCNIAGEIIGINSLKIGAKYNAEGLGFAIPINDVNEIVKKIMAGGGKGTQGTKGNEQPKDNNTIAPSKAILGILGKTAIPQEDGVKGVYVQEVTKGTGAEKAGLKPTDIIVEVDKNKITTMEELSATLSKKNPGEVVAVKIWRNGNLVETSITLSERKE